jgi:hypothetical protein
MNLKNSSLSDLLATLCLWQSRLHKVILSNGIILLLELVSWYRLARSTILVSNQLMAWKIGRRVCPGIQTAEQDIFIALSRLLWAFKFSAPPGVQVSADYHTAFTGEGIRVPHKFPMVIAPRSERRVQTIEQEMVAVQDVFSHYAVYNPVTHT